MITIIAVIIGFIMIASFFGAIAKATGYLDRFVATVNANVPSDDDSDEVKIAKLRNLQRAKNGLMFRVAVVAIFAIAFFVYVW